MIITCQVFLLWMIPKKQNKNKYQKELEKKKYIIGGSSTLLIYYPKIDKIWTTTKSEKVSIQDKLKQANKVVDDLENNIYPEKEGIQLPKYVSLVNMRDKQHLFFEKRIENKRLGLKMVLPDEYDLQEQLEILNNKIKEKYQEENISIL